MVKNAFVAAFSLIAFAACGVPDSEVVVSDEVSSEPEIMEAGQELSSSAVKDWFPLEKGNEWVFKGLSSQKTVRVVAVGTGIAYVTGLHAEGKWVGVSASTPNTLYAWDGDAGRWNVFIRFGYSVTSWTYNQSEGACSKFAARRTSTGQEYATVAGAFSDTRAIGFTMTPPANVRCAQPDFGELVFAARVGPIMIKRPDGEKFALQSAKVGVTTLPRATGSVVVKTTTDKTAYLNQSNTIRCITTPCPSNEVTAEAKVTITLVNTTSEVQSFRFNTGCQTNVQIFDATGKIVKNLETARMCTMALSTVALSPGQTRSWVETVSLISDLGEQLDGTYKVAGSVRPASSGWTGSLTGSATINVAVQ